MSRAPAPGWRPAANGRRSHEAATGTASTWCSGRTPMAPRQSRWLKVRGSSGPYAVVRHPMYGWALIMMLEIPLALGSWWGLVIVMPASAEIIVRLSSVPTLFEQTQLVGRHWLVRGLRPLR